MSPSEKFRKFAGGLEAARRRRVDALARRGEAVVKETVLRVGDLVSCTANRSGREIELLPRGFHLLEYLVRNDSGAFFIQPAAARHR